MKTSGFSAEWLARVCSVDLSTARRWKRLGFFPRRYRALVHLADGADLGMLSPTWSGWRLYRDELINPEGERFGVDQVRALRLKSQLAAELERQLRRINESPRAVLAPRELIIRVSLAGGELEAGPIHARAELELEGLSPN